MTKVVIDTVVNFRQPGPRRLANVKTEIVTLLSLFSTRQPARRLAVWKLLDMHVMSLLSFLHFATPEIYIII